MQCARLMRTSRSDRVHSARTVEIGNKMLCVYAGTQPRATDPPVASVVMATHAAAI